MTHRLEVGGFYGQPRSWAEAPVITGLSAERAEVLFCYSGLSAADVASWRAGVITAGLTPVRDLLVLTFRDALSSSDAPFHIGVAQPGERTPVPAQYLPLTLILLEAGTGQIRAIRYATVTPTFARQIRERTLAQLRRPLDLRDYGRQVGAYQASMTTGQLMSRAVVTETLGISEPPAPASAQEQVTAGQLRALYPALDPRVCEVMAETIGLGVARIEVRPDGDWYVDPEFGGDTPVLSLGYDETLGMVDMRR